MLNIKKIIIFALRNFYILIGFNKLNENERNGYISKNTKYKFLKTSHHILPFSNGLTIRGVSFLSYQNDSWGMALHASGKSMELKEEFIKKITNTIKKEELKTISDCFSFISNQVLSSSPLWSLVLPWEEIELNYKKKVYLKLLLKNRQENNGFKELRELEIPMHDRLIYEFCESHYFQFLKLFKSMSENGFAYNQERPRVYILVKNKKWKWIMSGQGNHRSLVARNLNYSHLPVEVRGIINKGHSKTWFNVKNNMYTKEEAEHIFDLFFSGEANRRGVI